MFMDVLLRCVFMCVSSGLRHVHVWMCLRIKVCTDALPGLMCVLMCGCALRTKLHSYTCSCVPSVFPEDTCSPLRGEGLKQHSVNLHLHIWTPSPNLAHVYSLRHTGPSAQTQLNLILMWVCSEQSPIV